MDRSGLDDKIAAQGTTTSQTATCAGYRCHSRGGGLITVDHKRAATDRSCAGAARQTKARVVALSLVYPSYDPQIVDELKCLRELLPSDIAIIVGGRAMADYHEILESIGAIQVKGLEHLASTLNDLRKPALKG